MVSRDTSITADAATVSPSDAGSPAGQWRVRSSTVEIPLSSGQIAAAYAGNPANARLIAAAPDLLAVVEALIAWDNVAPPETDEEIDAFDWEAKELTALIEAALAVRAKVTGQAAERWS